MAKTVQTKTIDISGIPFVVEKRDDGKYYIVAIRVRKREFFFESTGIPVEIVDKITGTPAEGSEAAQIKAALEGVSSDSITDEPGA